MKTNTIPLLYIIDYLHASLGHH